MRASVIVVLVLAAGIVVAASKSHNYSHFVKYHARPRVIRGYKPNHISTAIGYGKRQSAVDAPKMNKHERILSTLLRYFPQGYVYIHLLIACTTLINYKIYYFK